MVSVLILLSGLLWCGSFFLCWLCWFFFGVIWFGCVVFGMSFVVLCVGLCFKFVLLIVVLSCWFLGVELLCYNGGFELLMEYIMFDVVVIVFVVCIFIGGLLGDFVGFVVWELGVVVIKVVVECVGVFGDVVDEVLMGNCLMVG